MTFPARMLPRGAAILLLFSAAFEAARAADAPPPVVGAVAVEGNRFIKSKTILAKVRVRKGDALVDPSFRADVDRLLETGLYEDVQVSVEEMAGTDDGHGRPTLRVLFKVKERPIVRRIDFKGNKKLGDSHFREEITSKVDEPYDKFKTAQDVQKILGKYPAPTRSS
jgi:outer membrane protein insertion porin family